MTRIEDCDEIPTRGFHTRTTGGWTAGDEDIYGIHDASSNPHGTGEGLCEGGSCHECDTVMTRVNTDADCREADGPPDCDDGVMGAMRQIQSLRQILMDSIYPGARPLERALFFLENAELWIKEGYQTALMPPCPPECTPIEDHDPSKGPNRHDIDCPRSPRL